MFCLGKIQMTKFSESNPQRLCSIALVFAARGLHRVTVRYLIRKGTLHGVRLGRKWHVTAESYDRLMRTEIA